MSMRAEFINLLKDVLLSFLRKIIKEQEDINNFFPLFENVFLEYYSVNACEESSVLPPLIMF